MDFRASASGVLYNLVYLIYVEYGGCSWEASARQVKCIVAPGKYEKSIWRNAVLQSCPRSSIHPKDVKLKSIS